MTRMTCLPLISTLLSGWLLLVMPTMAQEPSSASNNPAFSSQDASSGVWCQEVDADALTGNSMAEVLASLEEQSRLLDPAAKGVHFVLALTNAADRIRWDAPMPWPMHWGRRRIYDVALALAEINFYGFAIVGDAGLFLKRVSTVRSIGFLVQCVDADTGETIPQPRLRSVAGLVSATAPWQNGWWLCLYTFPDTLLLGDDCRIARHPAQESVPVEIQADGYQPVATNVNLHGWDVPNHGSDLLVIRIQRIPDDREKPPANE